MEPCLMSVKRDKSILMNACSWEERAFAEDAQGPLGGFVWPPRSYSCSFCKREFRSAQALGGHMNVHRREKAKIKHGVTGATISALGQESCVDAKRCVYDEGFVVAHGIGVVETGLVLGFDLDTGGGKRRKGNDRVRVVTPPIVGGLDLELRLASFHAC